MPVVSKPEPKIDMKEEHVEPINIWKEVGGLYDLLLTPSEIYIFEIILNRIDQIQKDIQELKKKNQL